MYDVTRTYKHSALRWLGALAATDVENEAVRSRNALKTAENERRKAFNNNLAALPEDQRQGKTPMEMLPLEPELTPDQYVQKQLDTSLFSYAEQHADRIAAAALKRLATLSAARQLAVLTAMGLGYVAKLAPAEQADVLRDLAQKRFRSAPIGDREELASSFYPEYGPQS